MSYRFPIIERSYNDPFNDIDDPTPKYEPPAQVKKLEVENEGNYPAKTFLGKSEFYYEGHPPQRNYPATENFWHQNIHTTNNSAYQQDSFPLQQTGGYPMQSNHSATGNFPQQDINLTSYSASQRAGGLPPRQTGYPLLGNYSHSRFEYGNNYYAHSGNYSQNGGIENPAFHASGYGNHPEAGNYSQTSVNNSLEDSAFQQPGDPSRRADYPTRGDYSPAVGNFPDVECYSQKANRKDGATPTQPGGTARASNSPPAGMSSQLQIGGSTIQNGVITTGDEVTFTPAYVLACFTYWMCCWVFGGIAYVIAMAGDDKNYSRDYVGARKLLRASYAVSIVGFIVGTTISIVVAVLIASGKSVASSV